MTAPVVPVVEEITEAPFLNRTIEQIALGECHYPHGDSPFYFCGQPVQAGSWYCPHHHRVSYHEPDPSRRRDLGIGHGLATWRGVR